MKDHQTVFVEFLQGRGLKYTRNRKIILDIVFGLHEHFDAEQLYDLARKETRAMSRATVYRTIPLLCEAGLLQQSVRSSARDTFEHIYGHPKHIHWVCTRCGAVIETDLAEVMAVLKQEAKRIGFSADEIKFNVVGKCWKCGSIENE
ncbi:MAG: transcriptional repressor [Candidatus Cloacimonetes bacterium]|nr:transcriptional repressor [Candidatus Cloacimonadota bacterium]